jgi:hypothetical protein
MPLTPQELVQREVLACASSLISTLAGGYGCTPARTEPHRIVGELCEQALDPAGPIDDWEEAAIQAGWIFDPQSERWTENDSPDREGSAVAYELAETLCTENNLEPYQREVYEHWFVSHWFADLLAEQGEKVDKDFAGLCIWARTTTGQAISGDAVIERIAAKLNEAV